MQIVNQTISDFFVRIFLTSEDTADIGAYRVSSDNM